MNLPAAAAHRSGMEQSNVPDDTPVPQAPPAHCGYRPAECTAPASVVLWIREGDVLRPVRCCDLHTQYIGNAVTIVAVEEIKRAD